MDDQSEDEGEKRGQSREQAKQHNRANRILDAASELIQRWGYKKTTIDDIAKQAGVAKGTIYLHWKTKEDLIIALIMREKITVAQQVQQAMNNEPDGVTLYNMIKHSVLAALRNSLTKALMLRDTEMLGALVHEKFGNTDIADQLDAFNTYMAYLQEQGVIRTDIPLRTQVHMLEAISLGYLTADQFLPEQYHLPDEVRAAMAAETVHRTLEVRQPDAKEQQEARKHFQNALNKTQIYLNKETYNE